MSVFTWAARPDAGTAEATFSNAATGFIGQVMGAPETMRNIALAELLAGSAGVYNVKTLGAKGDGTTNDYAAIQNAINLASAAGGGTVYFPAGIYAIRTSLLVSTSCVRLLGSGCWFGQFASPFAGTPTGGTVIKALAGAVLGLAIAPNSGAANRSLYGCAVENLSIDANSTAVIGLAISSVSFSTFRNVYIANGTVAGFNTSTVATLNDNRTATRNTFDNFTVWNDLTNGDGMILDGTDAAADFGGNYFGLVQILHKNGAGIRLKNSDSNIFNHTYCNCIGSGTGVIFEGNNADDDLVARDNFFRWLSAGSVIARGTSSFTHPSRNNIIDIYDFGSNSNFPTIETGAGLTWQGNRGFDPGFRSETHGDSDLTIYPGTTARVQYFNVPLTSNRVATISGIGIDSSGLGGGGAYGRVVRSAVATGASTLTVQCTASSRVLAVGQWCDWVFDGQLGASVITAFGSL